ncbi:hypothetical protein [Streptomyces europaeiscabiei]|uniref:hypothetical protein n=1 Tax=Streptomyces europaeiscabiei TaxID=146819 RepID=UPI002E0E9C5B|nr:hypothetical protein OHB30_10865 [Streptomyces europaeiscabiei]
MTNVPEPPANPGDARALRDLLTVVLDALTLPYGTEDYDRRMAGRMGWAQTAVKGALADDPADIGWNADYLRGKLRAEETEAADRAKNRCARCRNPFDSGDTRFDGHARHAETAYCRGCVDNCHEGSAEHVCVICDPARYGAVR